jgi:hypothetical protein
VEDICLANLDGFLSDWFSRCRHHSCEPDLQGYMQKGEAWLLRITQSIPMALFSFIFFGSYLY